MKLVCVICICVATFPLVCQPVSNYQVATITAVKPQQPAGDSAASVVSYEVSVKVGDTTYVVLYTPPLGETTVKYVAGRSLLVLVGKKTITYNDILGRSVEVPIVSQKSATEAKQAI